MFSNVLQKVSRQLAYNSSGNGRFSEALQYKTARYMGYDWGHDTIQDQEERKRRVEASKVTVCFNRTYAKDIAGFYEDGAITCI